MDFMPVPKYILVFEPLKDKYNPFVIYEQAEIDGKIAHKSVKSLSNLQDALYDLGYLNDDKPVILAYSTKLMDNTFTI